MGKLTVQERFNAVIETQFVRGDQEWIDLIYRVQAEIPSLSSFIRDNFLDPAKLKRWSEGTVVRPPNVYKLLDRVKSLTLAEKARVFELLHGQLVPDGFESVITSAIIAYHTSGALKDQTGETAQKLSQQLLGKLLEFTGMPYSIIAEDTGLSENYIMRLKNGHRPLCCVGHYKADPEIAEKVAGALTLNYPEQTHHVRMLLLGKPGMRRQEELIELCSKKTITTGQMIDELRLQAGLSRTALAENMGVDSGNVTDWVNSSPIRWSETAERLAHTLGVDDDLRWEFTELV